MEKKGLIHVEIKGWKKGQEKLGRTQLLSITPKGEKWLFDCLTSSLRKILKPLSKTLIHLTHETDVKDSFRRDLAGISREDFDLAKNDVKQLFEPFTELFREIMILQLWLQPNYNLLTGIHPWMQLLERPKSVPEVSFEQAKQLVNSNYFLFGPNMDGFIPVPPLADDEKITMVYYQKAWKFVEQLSKHKGGLLPPPPLKSPPKNKDNNMRRENA